MNKWTCVKRVFIAVSVVGFGYLGAAQAIDISWEQIGTVKPRHAKEIGSSNWSVGAETMDRDYTIYRNWKDYLGPLGVKKARIQGGWVKTEKRKGVYDFGWLDEIVFDMNDQGVEPWMCLCYGNSLYTDGGGVRLGAQIPAGKESLRAWTLWIRAVISRYMDVIDEWEIWNEPNLRKSNAARNYAHFMLHTAENIRRIQPKAQIISMSTAGVDTKFVKEVLKIAQQQDKLHLIDQVTYHPYNHNPDNSYKAVAELRRTIKGFSPNIKIRQGENGCPSMRRQTKALRDYDWTEVSQAKWALRRLLGDLGRDIESSYFAIMDMKYPDEMNAKGLLKSREDQTVEYAKPAYHAVQNLTSIFDDNLTRAKNFNYTATTNQSISVFAYQDKENGFHIITIWLDVNIPSDSNAGTMVDFTFANVLFEQPVYVDLRTGAVFEIPESAYSVKGNEYTFTLVPCYDSPILIADRSNIYLQ
jgi:hypothetical protein